MTLALRIGQICGVVIANVISPMSIVLSWFLQPYFYKIQSIIHSQSQMIAFIHQYQHFAKTNPALTLSVLLSLLILMVLMLIFGFAYTLYMAKLGGKIAVRISRVDVSGFIKVLSFGQ